jgi:hypothetical protein
VNSNLISQLKLRLKQSSKQTMSHTPSYDVLSNQRKFKVLNRTLISLERSSTATWTYQNRGIERSENDGPIVIQINGEPSANIQTTRKRIYLNNTQMDSVIDLPSLLPSKNVSDDDLTVKAKQKDQKLIPDNQRNLSAADYNISELSLPPPGYESRTRNGSESNSNGPPKFEKPSLRRPLTLNSETESQDSLLPRLSSKGKREFNSASRKLLRNKKRDNIKHENV